MDEVLFWLLMTRNVQILSGPLISHDCESLSDNGRRAELNLDLNTHHRRIHRESNEMAELRRRLNIGADVMENSEDNRILDEQGMHPMA